MKGKIFLDTNIFIYLLSVTEPEKQKRCMEMIESFHLNNQTIVWSTQVIQELSYNLIKKRKLSPAQVQKTFNTFSHFDLAINDLESIQKALDITSQTNFSFWESLIISSAIKNKCSFIISEDLHHGQRVDGVEIANPFLV